MLHVMKLSQLIELDKGFQNFVDKDHFTLIAPLSKSQFEDFVREAKINTAEVEPDPILKDKRKIYEIIQDKFQGSELTIYWVAKHFSGALQFKSLEEYLM
jgi:hypothetical protein